MKNKRLSVTICACLLLVACGRAEQTAPAAEGDNAEDAEDAEEVLTDSMPEHEGWQAEENYIELDDYSVLTDISMEDVLLECTCVESAENYRFCVVLRDGNVYCANLYSNTISEQDYTVSLCEEILPYLRNVYSVGRVSADEIIMIEEWIDQIDDDDMGKDWGGVFLGKQESAYEEYLYVYGEKYSGMGKVIWCPRWHLATMTNEASYREGMDCYGGLYSQKIIQWVLDSYYMKAWYRHVGETGADKNPKLECDYVGTINVKVSGDYPGNEIFLVSTKEEFRYMKDSMGFDPDMFERCFRGISEQYPVEVYDYLIKVAKKLKPVSWKQNADSVRFDNDYLYFNYDYYGYQKPTGDLQIWIAEANAFIDIAVVAKGVLDTEIGSGLPSPQDMQLHPIEERKTIVVK